MKIICCIMPVDVVGLQKNNLIEYLTRSFCYFSKHKITLATIFLSLNLCKIKNLTQ